MSDFLPSKRLSSSHHMHLLYSLKTRFAQLSLTELHDYMFSFQQWPMPNHHCSELANTGHSCSQWPIFNQYHFQQPITNPYYCQWIINNHYGSHRPIGVPHGFQWPFFDYYCFQSLFAIILISNIFYIPNLSPFLFFALNSIVGFICKSEKCLLTITALFWLNP